MQILRATLETFEKKILLIGYQGENECTQVRIDASDVFAEYPNATPSMIIQPFSGDGFPCFVARDGNDVVWEITSTILSFRGDGEAQLTFIKDSVVKKSAVGNIRVKRSLAVTGETPSPVAQWIDAANAKLAEVDAQIVELEEMAEAAARSAEGAAASEQTATRKASEASASASAAKTSETNSKTSETNAAKSAADAQASETAAAASEQKAKASETSAAGSASTASLKATEATQSATGAAGSARTAAEKSSEASASATAAKTSETNSKTSETNAAKSASDAQASKTAATASEQNAKASETSAAGSALTASTKASEAAQSAIDADGSARDAAGSAESAEQSAQAAQDVLDSIPADYQTMVEEVTSIEENAPQETTAQQLLVAETVETELLGAILDSFSELPTDEALQGIHEELQSENVWLDIIHDELAARMEGN